MPKRTTDAPADPDALKRQSAGTYRTADERFEVRQADAGWFLVDAELTNDFGQELIHGPFATLKAVREAIPGSRSPKVVQLRPRGGKGGKVKATKAKADEPPTPPPSWIDALKPAEGRRVRRLIAALERAEIPGAEDLVRRDRDGLLPAVATRLIVDRIAAAVADGPDPVALAQRIAEILSGGGMPPKDPLPGWVLVEVPADEAAPALRRIDLRQ